MCEIGTVTLHPIERSNFPATIKLLSNQTHAFSRQPKGFLETSAKGDLLKTRISAQHSKTIKPTHKIKKN